MDKLAVNRLPETLAKALAAAADRWAKQTGPWLVGGSCGLVLHGVTIAAAPRDVDIYIDAADAASFHEALLPYALDEPCGSETERYRSILSHYRIGDVTIELVAGFEVRAEDALYRVNIGGLLRSFAMRTELNGARIGVMPLAHELAFNLLRERKDRYIAIAETMRKNLPAHLSALQRIVAENHFGSAWIGKMAALLCVPEDIIYAREEC